MTSVSWRTPVGTTLPTELCCPRLPGALRAITAQQPDAELGSTLVLAETVGNRPYLHSVLEAAHQSGLAGFQCCHRRSRAAPRFCAVLRRLGLPSCPRRRNWTTPARSPTHL